jgi:3-hydroxyisobutyrate dehydrogenase-like beta-hydroxyacid dehydrogenase
METQVGILHPGAMGISAAATIQNSGNEVWWASQGRSVDSRERAAQRHLKDAGSLEALCARCTVIVSVCPPHAAEATADAVLQTGFRGLYLDANAISPQRIRRIGQKMQAAGAAFVDGGIIGGPAWKPGETWLYLSGTEAEMAANCFRAGPMETEIIGAEIGKASALKMCFAANTKGATALLSAVFAAAQQLGVREELERQWSRSNASGRGNASAAAQNQRRVQQVTEKAWRFAGEMDEIADTFAEAGLPDGFHRAAGEIYRRMGSFKDAPDLPDLIAVLTALLNDSETDA